MVMEVVVVPLADCRGDVGEAAGMLSGVGV